MGIASRLQEAWYRFTGRTELAEVKRAYRLSVQHLEESVAGLEARMYEPGWQLMTAQAEQEFTREGLRQITSVNRVMALKNPLIKRGIALRTAYVWGQGLQVTARSAGQKSGPRRRGQQDVNAVVQAFMDDEGNRRALFSQQAHEDLERALGTDGNLFIAAFTNPRTGRVQARIVPWDEITEVITNPDDASEPWFYRRCWTTPQGAMQEAYYPAMGYWPKVRPRVIGFRGIGDGAVLPVRWDSPVKHISVNGPLHWKWGLGDVYAAIDWANAYREFLTDWSRLIKALSRFAWRLTSKGSKQAAAKTKMATAPTTDPLTGEPRFAGATAFMPPDMALEAIPKSGATIDAESGRPLAAMTAAALDVPVTMLLGDPGTTGARAVAETLDQPTELAMNMRRELWADVLRTIFNYVIDAAVKAPDGPLKGIVKRDPDDREIIELAGKTDRTIDITWPSLDSIDAAQLVKAIVEADSTQYVPPLVVVRLLLQALGVRDVDEILATLMDDQGNFVRPDGAGGGAGQAAMDAFRQGRDPAAAFGGGRDNPPDPAGPGGGAPGDAEQGKPAERERVAA
ncbi:hypothetical protein DQ384_05370 [Sphaerisporangium album]|uniref:Uncharacterized protein n=1 Tax=Sphaerisporangium album TaxID=509200 RepID=A0A367FNJ8_9ACTN|nr:hypothetical protein [Sphaerisporangium album]RCG31973.1 hypothetical protein DQ384_05370 [Sphaerisporangium album]